MRVEDAFQINGRGLVLVPGIVPQGEERILIGMPLLMRRPDGTELNWTVGGIEMISVSPYVPRNDVVILLRDLDKSEVPIGTEVWSVDEPEIG